MGKHRITPSKRGQTLVLFTLALPLMFMMVGLSVDIGWAYYRQQAAHAAAESAALAAVAEASKASSGTITCGSHSVVCQTATACPNPIPNPPTNNIYNGCLYAQSNGFAVTTGGNRTVLIAANTTSPPPTVSGVTTAYWVTATVAETIPQTFSSILGKPTATVSARSTAAAFSGGGGGCVYVLGPGPGTDVSMSGTATLQSGCGVFVDSSGSAAVLMSGSPSITATGGATVNIVGNWLKSGTGTISPAPNIGAPVAADPFAAMNPPSGWASYPNCTVTGSLVSGSGATTVAPPTPGGNCIVSGAINLSGSASIAFSPGFYVIKNGITTSGSASVSGAGVTFYDPTGGITMSGSGAINITAPTSGPWEGIAIFQDRSNSSGDTLSGGINQQINGVVYIPKGALTFSGGSGVSATNTTLVVNTITFSGATYIKAAASTQFTGGGGGIALIE